MTEAKSGQFSVTCWPGRAAAARSAELQLGSWGLMLILDPGDVLLTAAPFPGGRERFARWCRELSRESQRVASELDADDGLIQLDPSDLESDDMRHNDAGVAAIYQFPGGQPYAIEVRSGANVTVNIQPDSEVTSISFRKRDRMSLTIVLPEDVARQIFGRTKTTPGESVQDDRNPDGDR